jgi:hypothetical protein
VNDLSSGAKELVRAGRAATRLSLADRLRILSGLRSRLGDGAIPDASGSPNGWWSPGSILWKGMTVAVLCGLGAAGFLGLRAGDEEGRSDLASAPAPSIIVAAPELAAHPAAAQPGVPPLAVSSLPAAQEPRRESRARDRLAEEVAILSRAEADLHRGQAALALRGLDEHQRRFPDGALAVERRAARTRALCALGRSGEAKAELARLSRVARGSQLEARAREACGAATER